MDERAARSLLNWEFVPGVDAVVDLISTVQVLLRCGEYTARVIQPKEGFEVWHQLLARVVAVPTQDQVPLRVVNLSASPVTLYKGTNIVQFCPLARSDGTDAETAEYCEVPLSVQGKAMQVQEQLLISAQNSLSPRLSRPHC